MICTKCGTENTNDRESCQRCSQKLHPANMQGKIPCMTHGNREATTACGSCGNRLCASCAVDVNGIDFCENCAPADAVRHTFDEDYERVPVLQPASTPRASFGPRLLALVIDGALFVAVAVVLAMILWLLTGGNMGFLTSPNAPGGGAWFYLYRIFILGSAFIYAAVMISMTGQTLGKQVAGVIVLDGEGHILNVQTTLIRTAAALVSALPLGLGFLWALWDKNHETWHDKIAKTAAFQFEEMS